MPAASAVPALKAALITRLEARPLIGSAVRVLDHAPVNVDDVRTEIGTYEAIWVGEAEGPIGPIVLCDGVLRFDESPVLTLGIQVLGVVSTDTQAVVDTRVNELFYEVLAEIANQNAWDKAALALDVYDYFWCEPVDQRWIAGRLEGQTTFGARVELDVVARARRSFS